MTGPEPPRRSLRAIAAALLTVEALSVLLGLPTLGGGGRAGPGAVAVLVVLAGLLLAAAALLRGPVGRPLATAVQPLVVLAGLLAWPLFVLGAVFAALWLGLLRMERGLSPSP